MNVYTPQSVFAKPLFQRSLILFSLFIILATLFWIFGFGRPNLAVAIALDLSSSTHSGNWNGQGTIMAKEVEAVNAYLEKNALLSSPNQIQVIGFGSTVEELTSGFQSDSVQVAKDLKESLAKNPIKEKFIKSGTDLSLVITKGVDNLKGVSDRCREMLLVTDGDANVSGEAIAEAVTSKVKINSVIIGNESPAVLAASTATGGVYNSAIAVELNTLFTDKLFKSFNSNIRWVIFWLGCAWIAMMWMLAHPLDWFLQKVFNFNFSLAGRLALGNALFWTVATLGIVWRLTNGLAFLSQC